MNETPKLPRPDRSALRRALRILLADDSLTFRVATQGMLRRLGHRVDVVSDGRKALEAAIHKQYDVVLMDIRMPEMDGLEATRRIREQVTGQRRLRIIAVTADPPAGDDQWYLAAGMDDVLTKPLSSSRLAQALDRSGVPERRQASRPADESARGAGKRSASEPAPAPGERPVEVVVDGILCELRIWSEREWASLPECERPVTCIFCAGLGWVGAVPKIPLN